MRRFEDVIGLTEIKKAHGDVIKMEDQLSRLQIERRDKQQEILTLQHRLKDIHEELNRSSRGEDRWLTLAIEENALHKNESRLLDEFTRLENAERDAFHALSAKLRISHQREREHAERTKYWSLTGSLIGALLGIIGSSLGNELRMRKLKHMVTVPAAQLTPLVQQLTDLIHGQQEQVSAFVGDARTIVKPEASTLGGWRVTKADSSTGDVNRIVEVVREQGSRLKGDLDELKRLLAVQRALDGDGGEVVYVGGDMQRMLSDTERNIESKMKLQTMLYVVLFYSAVAVTVPILIAVVRGSS